LWVLTDLWNGGPTLLRTVLPNGTLGNFYDLQGRAILAGRLSIPKGALGAEAFVHNGHQYTYYGIFPSLIRIPVLLVTHDLDGRLTAISILLAWVITGLMAAMILWRCRTIFRGSPELGVAETLTYALVFVAIIGGSALINVAANPWVYSEDIAWSIALSLASLVALLRVLERQSWGRIAVLALAILAVNLTRGTAGVGWCAGAVVTGLWFFWGRSRSETRRWSIPTAGAGVLPLLASAAVSWLKFGVVNGYPLQDQVYYRTQHLGSINGGHYFSLAYLPTGLKAYVFSLGVHFSSVFPFITLPQYPVQPVGHVVLFGAEEMTSLPGSMPLLFLLSLIGIFGMVRPSSPLSARLLVIPFLAAAVSAGALLAFGFLDNRFVGDFLPLLVLGSAAGIAVVWEYLEVRGPRPARIAVGAISLLCIYGVVANFGMSITPTGWWSHKQAAGFVRAQQTVGNVIGTPLSSTVIHRKTLPATGPVGQIVIIGNCKKVYIAPSTGFLKWLSVDSGVIQGGVSCRSLLKRGS
jgi:hypothetical protein